jgi:peptidoglycan hydrolase-like protein with peptidoglycan-binding domain
VLATELCLAAGSLLAAESSTSNSTRKPSPRLASTHSANTHPLVKKTGAPTPASHSATHSKAASSSQSIHHTAGKTNGHASSVYTAKGAPNHAGSYAAQRKGNSGRSRYSKPVQPRTYNGQQRLARLHPAPERVQEIQQALIREGYMQGDPTGEWDSRTREAMLRYQTMHGFPPTGLPEAKSLMKMGLGPHPLSPELDHGEVGVANAGVTAPVQSVFSVSPDTPPGPQPAPSNLGTITPDTK